MLKGAIGGGSADGRLNKKVLRETGRAGQSAIVSRFLPFFVRR
jgi:hypothetical protein